jgi:hypothetical protein
VLDGAGDPTSVFIFQTNSTLITGSGSRVTLINGAQECNVFWQVGSSATLGTSSVFSGNILALTSITVTTGVTVHGRALARNGAVTLDNDTFTKPTCATAASGGGSTPTTAPGTTPTTSGPTSSTPPADTTPTPDGDTVTVPGAGTGGGTPAAGGPGGGSSRSTPTARKTRFTPADDGGTASRPPTSGGPGVPGVVGPPRTGAAPLPAASFQWLNLLGLLGSAVAAGALARAVPARRRTP